MKTGPYLCCLHIKFARKLSKVMRAHIIYNSERKMENKTSPSTRKFLLDEIPSAICSYFRRFCPIFVAPGSLGKLAVGNFSILRWQREMLIVLFRWCINYISRQWIICLKKLRSYKVLPTIQIGLYNENDNKRQNKYIKCFILENWRQRKLLLKLLKYYNAYLLSVTTRQCY